jgi:hypothetical protein
MECGSIRNEFERKLKGLRRRLTFCQLRAYTWQQKLRITPSDKAGVIARRSQSIGRNHMELTRSALYRFETVVWSSSPHPSSLSGRTGRLWGQSWGYGGILTPSGDTTPERAHGRAERGFVRPSQQALDKARGLGLGEHKRKRLVLYAVQISESMGFSGA